MFTYDAYKNKIKRIAAFRRFVFKFKVPIIAALVLIVSAVTTLLCTKGMITADLTAPESVLYGETYEVGGAEAFLSGIRAYEYAAENSDEWSTDKPTHAGKYRVRAVANGVFGKKYGNEKTFEILKRQAEINIYDEVVVYGDSPENIEIILKEENAEANKLVAADTLDIKNLEFDYADFTKEQTEVTVSRNSLKITNAKGENVTGCYDIALNSHGITFAPRSVEVRAAAYGAVYNGAPQSFETQVAQTTSLQLANGDTVTFAVEVAGESGTPFDVGNYRVRVKEGSVRIFKGNIDVTARYNMQVPAEYVAFNITPRSVYVTTESATKEYDGKPLVQPDSSHSGEVSGHNVIVTATGSVTDVYEGDVKNDFNVQIFDTNGRDVTHNYSVVPAFGTLRITRRKITVQTAGKEWEYDGTAHDHRNGYDYADGSKELVAGQEFSVTRFADITDAGTADNNISLTVIGGDLRNYDISYVFGKLTVTQRKVSILTGTKTDFVYDGNAHVYASFDITSSTKAADNETISVMSFTSVVNAETRDNKLEFEVTGINGDVTRNYELSVSYGKITVNPRRITFDTGSLNVEYDGVPKRVNRVNFATHENGYDGFVLDHYAQVKSGAADISILNVSESGKPNDYKKEDYVIMSPAGQDVSANYEIVGVTAGTLTVTERIINVTTASAAKEYDALPLTAASAVADRLAAGHTLRAIADKTASVTDYTANAQNNNDTRFDVLDSSGNTVTENYRMFYAFGTLTVTKRTITVTSASDTKTYDGDALYNGGFTHNGKLVAGHEITRTNALDEITDVGETYNNGEFAIHAGGVNVTANYEITRERGTLKVTPRNITIKSRDKSFVYDSAVHVWEEHDVTAGSLVAKYDHKTEVISNSRIENAGNTPNVLDYRIYATENGVKVYKTGNYNITREAGTLTVTPRPLWIETKTDEFTYDGKGHAFSGNFTYKVQSDNGVDYLSIVSGHELGINTRIFNEVLFDGNGYDNVNVVGGDNTLLSDDSWDILGTDKSNYSLRVTAGKITVKRKPINVTTNSATKEYDGTELKDSGVKYDALAENHSIGATGTLSGITDVGTAVNKFAVRIVNIDSENPDLTRNYDITYTYGTLTVTKRNLHVDVKSESWVYSGEAHYSDKAEFFHSDVFGNIIDGFGLVSGHVYESASDKIYVTNVWDSGRENDYSYKIKSGNTDVTANYNFAATQNGTLTVMPRKLSIERLSDIKEYDGTPLYGIKFSVPQLPGYDNKLVSDTHKIEPIAGTVTQITDYGTVALRTEYTVTCATESRIHENYDILYHNEFTPSNKHLSVTQRIIRVTTPSASKVYDDTPLTAETGEVYVHLGEDGQPDGQSAFVLGHKLNLVSQFGGIIHVGQTKQGNNVLEYTVVAADGSTATESGNTVNNNYKIIYVYGTLTVTERPLKVTTGSSVKTYDDYDIGIPAPENIEEENALSERGLIAGQELRFITGSMEDFRNAVSKPNTAKYTVHYKGDNSGAYNGGDISEDYLIEYTLGTLTVNKKDLHITTGSVTIEYDGSTYWADWKRGGSLTGIIEGHVAEINVDDYTNICDVGTKTNVSHYKIFGDVLDTNNTTREVTENYNITYAYGTLTVTKRNIVIYVSDDDTLRKGKDYEFEYNGTAQYNSIGTPVHVTLNSDGTWTEDGKSALVFGHVTIATGNRVTVTNVADGTKKNIYDYIIFAAEIDMPDIWDDDAVDAARNQTANYNIVKVVSGTIKITPRNILIRRDKSEKVYDGLELRGVDYTATHVGDDEPALVQGHTLRPVESTVTKITYVLESTAYSGKRITTEYEVYEGDTLSTNYYIQYADTPEITVHPRPVTVLTSSDTKVYDGTPLTKYSWTVTAGDLVSGEELVHDTAKFSAFITDAGETDNELSLKVTSGEHDRTSNYALTVNYGTLTVTRRVIYVTPEYCEHTYNGKIYEYRKGYGNFEYITDDENSRVVSGELLEISVEFRRDGVVALPKNAGGYNIYITGYATADGKQNYEIYQAGTLNIPFTIAQRTVYLTPDAQNREYDGTAYSLGGKWLYTNGEENTPEEHKVIDGDDLRIEVDYLTGDIVWGSVVVNAGAYNARITGYNTNDGEQNYIIESANANFQILRRKVASVTPLIRTETYNKQPVTVIGYVSDSASGNFGIADKDVPYLDFGYEYFTKEGGEPIAAPVNAGTYYTRAVMNGGTQEALDNYDFTDTKYLYGRVEIYPKNVTVRPIDGKQKYYDGESASYQTVINLNGGTAFYILDGTVYDGDEIYYSVVFSGTVLHADGTGEYIESDSVTEVAAYKITFMLNAELNVNYNVTVSDVASYFEIKKLYVSVTTAGGEFIYNGEKANVASEGKTEVSDEVAAIMNRLKHTLVESGGSGLNNACDAGTYTNDRNVSVVKKLDDGTAEDVSHNYEIDTKFGVVIIKPATLTVRALMSSYEREYNGKPFEIAAPQVTGFAKDHRLANYEWQKLINAGTYASYKLESYDITDGSGNNLSAFGNPLKNNYVLEYECTAITVTPRKLEFAAAVDEREFNGKAFELLPSEFISNLGTILADGDVLTVEYFAEKGGSAAVLKNAGEYTVTLTNVLVNGVSVLAENSNYVFENNGMLTSGQFTASATINKYSLKNHGVKVTVANSTQNFTGYKLYGKNDDVSSEGLPDGFAFAGYEWLESVLYPDETVPNRPSRFIIRNAAGEDYTDNFDFDGFDDSYYTVGNLSIACNANLKPSKEGATETYTGTDKFGVVDGNVNGSDILAFTAEIYTITLDGVELTGDNKRVRNAGKYVITYTGVKYFLNGAPLDGEYANKLTIKNNLSFSYEITKISAQISPEQDSLDLIYGGSGKADVLGLGATAEGLIYGHRFELTQVKRSMRNYTEKTFDRVGNKLEVEVPLSVSSWGAYVYSGGKIYDGAEDVTANYDINFTDSAVKVSFERIAVSVQVNRRPAEIVRNYNYTGTNRDLKNYVTDLSFFTVSGLYAGHKSGVGAVTLSASTGIKARWFTLKVTDVAGADVSALYTVSYEYAENTELEVVSAEVVIRGSAVSVNGEDKSAVTFNEHVVDRDLDGIFDESGAYVYYKLGGGNHYVRVSKSGGEAPVFMSIDVRLDDSGLRHYTVRKLSETTLDRTYVIRVEA